MSTTTLRAAETGLRPPEQLESPTVVFPTDAPHRRAAVVLELQVQRDGVVSMVRVVSGEEPFAEAAEAAGWRFRFRPATYYGVPIPASIRAVVRFEPKIEPELAPRAGEHATAPRKLAPGDAREAAPITLPKLTVAPSSSAKPRGSPADDTPSAVTSMTVLGARREIASTRVPMSEVQQIPGVFGDPFRAIEVLPGVTPLVSGLPFFYVRGAPPGNVGYFIDGIRVPLLFHVGAGPAVIAPGIIESIDFQPSGYPARHGRVSGGVVAGETSPPSGHLRGAWNLRLFDASVLAESPFLQGRGDGMVAGKFGYPGLLLPIFSPNTSLQYWDYQLRVGYRVGERGRVSSFVFGAFDELRDTAKDLTLLGSEFHRADIRWDQRIEGEGSLRLATTLMTDRTRSSSGSGNGDQFTSSMLGLGMRFELERDVFDSEGAGKGRLRAGGDLIVERFQVSTWSIYGGAGTVDLQSPFRTRDDVSGGLRADLVWRPHRRLELVPGVRFDLYAQGPVTATTVEPRLASKLKLHPKLRWLVNIGLAHQWPTFPIPGPALRPALLNQGLQEAWQMSQGIEVDLPGALHATLNTFHTSFVRLNDLFNACVRSEGDSMDPDRNGCSSIENRSDGRAYGLELLIRRPFTERLAGLLSYTLSRTERRQFGQTSLSDFDRPHVLTLVLGYDFRRGYRVGGRFNWISGRAQTLTMWPNHPQMRLPDFIRLDVRAEKRWTFGAGGSLTVAVEWFNATLNKEPTSWECQFSYYDNGTYDSTRRDGWARADPRDFCRVSTIGPITIPSVGVEGAF